jgi:hypothetical protein
MLQPVMASRSQIRARLKHPCVEPARRYTRAQQFWPQAQARVEGRGVCQVGGLANTRHRLQSARWIILPRDQTSGTLSASWHVSGPPRRQDRRHRAPQCRRTRADAAVITSRHARPCAARAAMRGKHDQPDEHRVAFPSRHRDARHSAMAAPRRPSQRSGARAARAHAAPNSPAADRRRRDARPHRALTP